MRYLSILLFPFLFMLTVNSYGYVSMINNQELYKDCKEATKGLTNKRFSAFNAGRCIGYILGVIDCNILYASILSGDASDESKLDQHSLFCIPMKVKGGELIKVYMKFIDDNPDFQTRKAVVGIYEAYKKEYPCKKEETAKP